MQAEQDHLVKAAFPELREWCAKRRLHMADVDLRWGVTEEEVEEVTLPPLSVDEQWQIVHTLLESPNSFYPIVEVHSSKSLLL